MHSVIKLSQKLSALSEQLVQAQHAGDTEEQERLEEEIFDIQDQLDELEDFEDHHDFR